ncbi:hypothetical protein RJ641_016534 [Dillenia turbinata]|uniref:Uncharacterized protein n=1 Tax=Dillenia turbinata TaxID=194707 RepID=A0AAN8UWI7_9MAGN
MFHVAGNKEAPVSTKVASSLSNAETGSCSVGHQRSELLTVSSGLREQQVEHVALRFHSKELDNKELNETGTFSSKNTSMPSVESMSLKASFIADQNISEGDYCFGSERGFDKFNNSRSLAISDFSKIETQRSAGVGSSSSSSMREAATDASLLTNNRGLHKFSEASNNFIGNIKHPIPQIGSTQSVFGGEVTLPKDADARSLFSLSLYGRKSEDTSIEGAGNASVVPAGKLFNLKSGSGSLAPAFSSSRTIQKDSPERPAVMLKTEPNLSKVRNVKEMVKELDTLPECIEKEDAESGWMDAFEEGDEDEVVNVGTLASDRYNGSARIEKCYVECVTCIWQGRYLDGMVKQASDGQDGALWAQQKLSSKLALKPEHVFEISKNLTKQLIELERHFNALELNKLGENEGTISLRALRRSLGPSRHMQSLHSLQNTMNSQLAAAELLSECLSTQMSLLSIKLPPTKQKNVRKELFDTIGIPYHGVSFNSPDVWKCRDIPPIKYLLFLSHSATVKYHSSRKQASVAKNDKSETTRRGRDSLDRSWASFEPQKTVVKRILLEDSQKARADESFSMMWRQSRSTHMPEGSLFLQTKNVSSPSNLFSSKSKGIQDIPTKPASQASTSLLT